MPQIDLSFIYPIMIHRPPRNQIRGTVRCPGFHKTRCSSDRSYAHDALTSFMSNHGFEVTRNYHLETAWLATFKHGDGGRTIGVNSEVGTFFAIFVPQLIILEMDALPGVGHACGHNLIAISGPLSCQF